VTLLVDWSRFILSPVPCQVVNDGISGWASESSLCDSWVKKNKPRVRVRKLVWLGLHQGGGSWFRWNRRFSLNEVRRCFSCYWKALVLQWPGPNLGFYVTKKWKGWKRHQFTRDQCWIAQSYRVHETEFLSQPRIPPILHHSNLSICVLRSHQSHLQPVRVH
jgi:hypothetical protein